MQVNWSGAASKPLLVGAKLQVACKSVFLQKLVAPGQPWETMAPQTRTHVGG